MTPVVVEDNYYFPPVDLAGRFLHRSRMKSLCPWKGVAPYYTVEVAAQRDVNPAGTYRHPSALALRIRNHTAFWGNVSVREAG